MMVIPRESEFKLILFDPTAWSSQNVPDPVQKYFTAPSVPDHDEAGFRVLTVLMSQNGGRAGAGALLAAPGVGKVGGGHILCVSWGPKQLLLWVKEGRSDPSCPSPAPARALHALAAWGGRKERQACHGAPLLAISLAAPSLALFFRPLVIKTSQ